MRKSKKKSRKKINKLLCDTSPIYFSGSGILLLEYYRPRVRNGRGRPELCAIIFRNPYKNCYEEGGGRRDKGEQSPEITACRELMEESSNLFRLNSQAIAKCPVIKQHDYICYTAAIKSNMGIQSKYYYHNIATLYSNGASHCWLETDKLARIPIKALINPAVDLYDIDGNIIVLSDRCKACVRELSKVTKNFTSFPTFNLNYSDNYVPSNYKDRFLVGTKTYWN